jgi:hypothetical protein
MAGEREALLREALAKMLYETDGSAEWLLDVAPLYGVTIALASEPAPTCPKCGYRMHFGGNDPENHRCPEPAPTGVPDPPNMPNSGVVLGSMEVQNADYEADARTPDATAGVPSDRPGRLHGRVHLPKLRADVDGDENRLVPAHDGTEGVSAEVAPTGVPDGGVEAAWEALLADHDLQHPSVPWVHSAIARHRPIIEAATRATTDELDAQLLGMAMDLVDEEDARLGVVNRGRKSERVAGRYAKLRAAR